MAGVAGLNTGLSTANGGNDLDLLQLIALLGGSQQQSVSFQPAQLLQVRQALAQQQAKQVDTHQAEIQKRVEAEATKRAGELVKIEREKQKQKRNHKQNGTKQVEDDTAS